jgi:hypothetical protein
VTRATENWPFGSGFIRDIILIGESGDQKDDGGI